MQPENVLVLGGMPLGHLDQQHLQERIGSDFSEEQTIFETVADTQRSHLEGPACPQGLGTALGPKEGSSRR